MTTSDLLRELRTFLRVGTVSYNSSSAANDVYEGFLFSLVVATARDSNAAVRYETVRGVPASLASLPLSVARGFAGLKDDLGRADVIFAANTGSNSVKKYLDHRGLTREFQAIPGSREVEHLRTHIREALKSHVSRYDPGFEM